MRALSALLLLTSTFLFSSPAWACACCAFEGERLLFEEPIESEQLGLLKLLAPTKARLFMTAAGPDAVRGIPEPQEAYSVATELTGDRWTWRFGDGDRSGKLTLTLPPQQEVFAVDLPDSEESEAGGPLLYREIRLTGTLAGDGMFAQGLEQPARYQLVLQGYGNNCLQPADLRQWRLQVSGETAEFAFYGPMEAAVTSEEK